MKTKPRIIFFGTPQFALLSLEKLWEEGYPIVAVVTAPDAPVGRNRILTPPPVKVWAEKHEIPVLQPDALVNYCLLYTSPSPRD